MLLTLGGRKYILTVATHIVSSILLWYGKLDSSAYSMIVLGTVAVYIAGNVHQKSSVGDDK